MDNDTFYKIQIDEDNRIRVCKYKVDSNGNLLSGVQTSRHLHWFVEMDNSLTLQFYEAMFKELDYAFDNSKRYKKEGDYWK